ncbi:MAG: hypothetical protein HFH82_16395 [Lachnospiraceae bacterium]|nr:hypothetical protein [Lachnospiraceae bacterium]
MKKAIEKKAKIGVYQSLSQSEERAHDTGGQGRVSGGPGGLTEKLLQLEKSVRAAGTRIIQ